MMRNKIYLRPLILVIVLLVPLVGAAQTTEFTYQGKLVDGALPANANYDFEFRLFAIDGGGAAIATQTRLSVPVAAGVFSVSLDFGGQFDGNARWLEIAVKPAGSPNPPTVLTPRQPITSTPYSIRSLSSARADVATNSLQLGGVNASQYVLTTDPRMTDARSPLPNSSNYVQNTTAPQSFANFNISGNGTAGGTLSGDAVNATTQYNIGGSRILSNAGSGNLFAGVNAGQANSGSGNAFFAASSGFSNTTGMQNSFFGNLAGVSNTTGHRNSFFGYRAGQENTRSDNSFFGYQAGQQNTAGNDNSFFGGRAGVSNTLGTDNSLFGKDAGDSNTTGSYNSFFGSSAGVSNTTGESNSFFGYFAGHTNTTGSNNTAIGYDADIGGANLTFATAIGSGAEVRTSNTVVLGRSVDDTRVSGKLALGAVGTAGLISLCLNDSKQISHCSSSLRYKTEVQPFTGGLNIVNRLRPITFNWREGGTRDVGFGAEDVEKIEPLLVTYNDKGEIEGVKYGQLTVALVNSIQQQQQIIEQQRRQLDALKRLVCLSHPQAEVCR